MTPRNRGLYLALAGVLLLFGWTCLTYRLPSPSAAETPPTAFSAPIARAILHDLVGAGTPHPMGSRDNARMRDAIVQRLSALGYAVELETGLICNPLGVCGTPTNIIARAQAAVAAAGTDDQDIVLLAAHYDSVAAGPGASDDGVGVASVLEIARIVPLLPKLQRPIAFLITDGEEAGLLGAALFVRGPSSVAPREGRGQLGFAGHLGRRPDVRDGFSQ